MERILVVDDEDKIRAIIRKYGEFEGYEIAEAHDGIGRTVEILPERRFVSDHTGCDDAGTGWLFHLPGNPQVQRDPCHYALGTRRGV